MKQMLPILCLINVLSLAAQHPYKCSIYMYYGVDSSHKKLFYRLYFNDYRKIVREEKYERVYNGKIINDTVCQKWTEYFYKDDTILFKSVNYNVRSDRNALDSGVQTYSYDYLRRLLYDTMFNCSDINYMHNDLLYSLYGCDTSFNEYFYDLRGNKVEEINTYFFHVEDQLVGYKHRYTWLYKADLVEEYFYTADFLNTSNLYSELRIKSKTVRKYKDEKIISEEIYSYDDSGRTDTSIAVHTYSLKNGKITLEKIAHPSVLQFAGLCCVPGAGEKGITTEYIEYGYFPDKRKIKSTYEGFGAPQTTIYIYE